MRVLTVVEAAREMRISAATVYRLIARGKLPAVAIGKRRLVTDEALEAFLRDGGAA